MMRLRVVLFIFVMASASTTTAEPGKEVKSLQARISEQARQSAVRIDFENGKFSGPGWDMLVAEGKASQFFLLGEEHGIAENPQLASALFTALAPEGYSLFVIETSPQMATALESAARKPEGIAGLRGLIANPASNVAFFGMLEESDMLVDIAQALPRQTGFLCGVDYEVLAERYLITLLEAKEKSRAAQEALAALRAASNASWNKYKETRNPQYIFSFAADPALVVALRNTWPEADAESRAILNTLEETFAINQLWTSNQGWASNARRVALMRSNFLDCWQQATRSASRPKVFFKLGATHLVRGRSMTEVYDLGTLLPELAAIEGSRTFQLLVLPGKGSRAAVFDPTTMRYVAGEPKDSYVEGLEPITAVVAPDAFTLIDLRPLRPLLSRMREGVNPDLMRTVHGFDALLVMSGSTPSSNLIPESAKP